MINQLKDKLINSLSHNLKTPINGLMGHIFHLKQKLTKKYFLSVNEDL